MGYRKIVCMMVCLGVCAAGALAADRAPDWEKVPEPALQPYKSMWEGMKSFAYHSRQAFIYGNVKCPFFGSVEIFRGMRRGAIELASDSYMGMAGSKPRPYKELNTINAFIEEDPLLRHASDFVAPAAGLSAMGAANAGTTAVGIFAAQKVVDEAPMNCEARTEIKAQRATRYDRVKAAQHNYIGDRAKTNAAPDGMGNLLKRYY